MGIAHDLLIPFKKILRVCVLLSANECMKFSFHQEKYRYRYMFCPQELKNRVVALEALSRLACLMPSLVIAVVALSIISTLVQVDAVSGGSIQHFQPVRWTRCQIHPSCHPARWRLWMHYHSNHLHNLHVKYQPSGAGGTRSPPATPHRLQRLTACNA